MSAFTGPLSVTELDADCRLWRLDQDLVYEVGALGSGKVITAPKGMITDGASVPRALWSVVPPWGSYSRAAVIHDRLCYLIAIGQAHPLAPNYEAAAAVFDEAMSVLGTPAAERAAMADAVRLWFEIPNHFRPGDANPYPCGSVQPVDVVMAQIAAIKAGSGPAITSR